MNPEMKTTYQYVMDLRERLEETCKLAHQNLDQSSRRYKNYYDKKAKMRSYKVHIQFWKDVVLEIIE